MSSDPPLNPRKTWVIRALRDPAGFGLKQFAIWSADGPIPQPGWWRVGGPNIGAGTLQALLTAGLIERFDPSRISRGSMVDDGYRLAVPRLEASPLPDDRDFGDLWVA